MFMTGGEPNGDTQPEYRALYMVSKGGPPNSTKSYYNKSIMHGNRSIKKFVPVRMNKFKQFLHPENIPVNQYLIPVYS